MQTQTNHRDRTYFQA